MAEAIGLREIIRKIGHQLEEIRLRAIENILSKLRNQLICIEDLVHHRELIVNLLQWFNFENVTKIGEVLQLLEQLSKNGNAAATIFSLGGFEFLSTLRQDITDKTNLDRIDNILNNLFWIHTEQEIAPQNVQDVRAEDVLRQPNKNETAKDYYFSSTELSKNVAVLEKKTMTETSEKSDRSWKADTLTSTARAQVSVESKAEIVDVSHRNDIDMDEKPEKEHSSLVAEWIILTSSDRHILSVTESRLQSHSPSLVIQSCEFFRDVLLQDFPTHIFIQRPNILKTLLHLLEIYSGKDESIVSILFSCLSEVTKKLYHNSLQQRNDNLIELPKVNENSSPSESSVHTEISSLHSRGASFEGQSSSTGSKSTLQGDTRSNAVSDFEEYEGVILTEALQQSQWTGLDFCLNLLSSCCSYLMNYMQQTDKCEEVIIIMNRVLEVLGLYDIPAMWELSTNDRKIYDIMACLRKVSDLLQLCIEAKDGFINQSEYNEDIRSIFVLLVNLTMISVSFINGTVPLSRVYEAVPENLLRCFKLIFTDELLCQCFPYVRFGLDEIIRTAEDEFYDKYKHATAIIDSMRETTRFLKQMESQDAKVEFSSLLGLCEQSLPSVGFHNYSNFVKTAVLLVSDVNKSKDVDPLLVRRCNKILLRLLSHDNEHVQENAYQSCLDIITEALGVSHVTEPLSSSYQKAAFIVNSKILEEIVCFGLQSSNKKIRNYCTNITVTLLLGRLNMSPRLWQTLLDCCLPVMPILQGYASEDKALQRALVNLSDSSNALLTSSGELYSLPPLEQLRSSIRFMFVRDSNLRAKGFASVVWLLTQEDSRNGNAVRYPFESIHDASSMLIVDPSISLRYSNTTAGHNNFVASQIDQLWDIFTSSSVDTSLRDSAAEQLSILLQDQSWHNQLLDEGGKDFLIETLHSKMSNVKSFSIASVDVDSKLLHCCVSILKSFATYNPTVRHTLAFEKNLYLDLIKAKILFTGNESFHYETSCLLLLMVFDEFIRKGETEAVSLPSLVSKRYVLPFTPELYQLSTEFRDKSDKKSKADFDSLSEEPLFSMIKISWNIIFAGKAEQVKLVQADKQNGNSLFSPLLYLSENEARILRETLPQVSIKRHLETLKQSHNHVTATNCIRELRKYVLASICRDSAGEDVFSDAFDELLKEINEGNILSRILLATADKNRMIVLESAVSFSNLLVQTTSASTLDFAMALLRSIMQEDNPIFNLASSYSLQNAKKADFPGNQEGPYDSANKKRLLFKDTLRLILSSSQKTNSNMKQDTKGIGNFISVIVQSLVRVDPSSYYDLPVLETTLDCLYHVTYRQGWSLLYSSSGEGLCNTMANALIQILHSFHVDRIGAATSFMGKGVMMKAALCLCHVAKESRAYSGNKDWSAPWIHQDAIAEQNPDAGIPWLVPLLTDRVIDMRWAGWSLATALLDRCIGSEYVINEFQVYPGGVWASAIGVFLDNRESAIVRSQASTLLATLLLQLLKSGDTAKENDMWNNMVVQDTNTKANISGFPAFLLLLDHFQFFKKVKDLLLQKSVLQTPASSGSRLHNVSTSCSTPASDIVQRYEQISNYSDHEQAERTSSLSGYQSEGRDSNNERIVNTEGSSAESLLLGNFATPSESVENGERVYRLTFDQSANIHYKPTQRNVNSNRLSSSLFKLLSLLVKIDPSAVISSLENEGLVEMLVRFFDPELITQITCNFNDSLVHEKKTVKFRENAEMTRNLLILINLIVTNNPVIVTRLQNDKQFIGGVLSTFRLPQTLKSVPKNMSSSLFDVWQEALRVLYKLIGESKELEKTAAESMIIEHVNLLAYACPHAFSNDKSLSSTSRLFLALLKSILCRESRREKQDRSLSRILDTTSITLTRIKDSTSKESNKKHSNTLTHGEYLCDILCDKSQHSKPEKKQAVSTLSILFAVNISSKSFAVKQGFLESVLEDVKDIHVKLNLASLQLDKDNREKRKEKPLLVELSEIYDMLRNLLYQSQETKEAAIESGLIGSIQKMWSWCMIDKTLKIAVLELLVTLTADCKKAQEMLCCPPSQKGSSDESSLFPSILKLATKLHKDCMAPTGKIDSSTRLTFQLISNIAVLPECRGLLWKNNIYQLFSSSQIGQNANKKQKVASRILTALWVQLLLVISFYADGTHVILKVNGLLATLIDFASEEQHRERQRCLLILRNLLFFPANKPSLLTNSRLVSCLLKALDSKSVWSKAIVVSCFASLLHNCHKAKVTLKRTNLFGKIRLIQEEILTGKLISKDWNMQGYQELKTAVSKTLKILSE